MTDAQQNPGNEEIRELKRFVDRRTTDIEEGIDKLHRHTERRLQFLAVYVTFLAFLVALSVTADHARTFVLFVLIPLFLVALIVYLWQVLLAPYYARQRTYRHALSRVEARKKEGGEGTEETQGAEDTDAQEQNG